MIVFHVTKTENIDSILDMGLIPQIGPRAEDLGETEKAVYLFPTEEDMNIALSSWLGECFNEDESLTSLRIILPDNFPLLDGEVEYELLSQEIIPPEYIEVFREE